MLRVKVSAEPQPGITQVLAQKKLRDYQKKLKFRK